MRRRILKKLQYHYERSVAPFLAERFCWLYLPLYFICRIAKICFVVNIASSTGHIMVELDNFFRARYLGDISPDKRYVWLKQHDSFAKATVGLYGHHFWFASHKPWLYNLFLPLIMRYKSITFDAGISRLKWQLPRDRTLKKEWGQTFLHQISKKKNLDATREYFKKCRRCPTYFPMKDFRKMLTPELDKILPLNKDKIALIHCKDTVRNSTSQPQDPQTYCKAIEYLIALGYSLIFVGREKMPPLFHKYGVINYSESPAATFTNDIHLFSLAKVIILTGCGISTLADCLDKHYLYLNSWHIAVPPFSKKAIYVPALVRDLAGKQLTLNEQNELYKALQDIGPEVFPHSSHEATNASGEDILHALQELLVLQELDAKPSPLQQQVQQLDPDAPLAYASSRCSHLFLEKNKALICDI